MDEQMQMKKETAKKNANFVIVIVIFALGSDEKKHKNYSETHRNTIRTNIGVHSSALWYTSSEK